MSDLIAGPAAGGAARGSRGPDGGAPPPVLIAALAAAALIAVVLFAALGRFGGGDERRAAPAGAVPAAVTVQRERVMLTVTLLGSGDGVIQIQPGDIACTRSCDHEFDKGTRVTVTADPPAGSTFAGWDDACAGSGRCSILMDAARTVDAKFESKPAEALCDEDLAAVDGSACPDDLDGAGDLDAGDDEVDRLPAGDCADGRDNDGDGLTDSAQDPDCTSGGAEAGSGTPPAAVPPPPAATKSECSDGKDNDRDGLTDRAQDPNCLEGSTESG